MGNIGRQAAAIGANFIPGIGPIASAAIQAAIQRRPGDGILSTAANAGAQIAGQKLADGFINRNQKPEFSFNRQSPLDAGAFSQQPKPQGFFSPLLNNENDLGLLSRAIGIPQTGINSSLQIQRPSLRLGNFLDGRNL